MKFKLFALLAYLAYEYDQHQISKGKKSMFGALGECMPGNSKTQPNANNDTTNRAK